MIDKKKLLIIVVISLFVLSLISNIYQSCQGPKIVSVKEKIDTTNIKRQFKAELETKLRAELKPIIKTKTIVKEFNADSLKQAVDEYWKAKIQAMNPDVPVHPNVLGLYSYTAYADTSLHNNDSVAFFSATYSSRIPLDPEAKMSIEAIWYERQITHTTETTIIEQKTFLQRLFGSFHYSIQAGAGMDLISQKPVIYYGLGISFDIKDIF